MGVGLQHEHAVEFRVLLDFGAVDGDAVVFRVGEETAVDQLPTRLLSPFFSCRSRAATMVARLAASFVISSRLRHTT
jgi:hypothetical protein